MRLSLVIIAFFYGAVMAAPIENGPGTNQVKPDGPTGGIGQAFGNAASSVGKGFGAAASGVGEGIGSAAN
ncbi:hypothetical protein BDV27DRAFT_120791 [Aspergillus caelatus]|uniref:Uncharacterized protein n=1 Tax=Aspergillus caelatus TaxID=61420 RepID=A0A5N7ALF0_9EURO|nr:uncharacterized protein BDV27DRAFT_120791 [Aspergillus caelatus]KAE8369540.1 hypothetical protein BDV27DRAFT_120791 [Aspergillus caelatus]